MEKMEESFVFECPICGKDVEAPRNLIGMQAECPGCDSQITVPDPDRPVGGDEEEMSFDLTHLEEEKSRTTKIDIPDAPELRTPVKRKIVIKRL
ncbi:MAG: hypothetical protein PHP44_10395 [Kiritimatiellae bacterium]|nr:hypothetical protein [Kiritimatiellia bacterium]MDD4736497.1 hypothetical protein [Kiritimatiellia bacterium]